MKKISIASISRYLFPLIALGIIISNPVKEYPLVSRMIAVVILMAGWWISEAVPIAITSLLPLVLFPALGILDGGTTAVQYFNDIIFLFMGGFILALAMEKWDLHLKIAFRTLLFFGSKPYKILVGFMVASSLLSMWMSNTATAILMLPIAISVINEMEHIHGKQKMIRFRIGLLLGIAYSCSIGGITTLIGTPPNLAFVAIFANMYPDAEAISFSTWFIFALPLYLMLITSASLVLYLLFRPKIESVGTFRKYIQEQNYKLGKSTYEQKIVMTVFSFFALLLILKSDLIIGDFRILGWSNLFPEPKYIRDGTVAIFFAVFLFVIPSKNKTGKQLMDWKTAVKLPWSIILLFGGGFALAKGAVDSGMTQWIAQGLVQYAGAPPIVFIGINTFLMAFLTEFTSNISTTQILLPVIAAMSESLMINPKFLMIPVTIASSLAFMLPIATPPNAIVFGSKYLHIKDMILPGFILNIVGIILVTLCMYFWGTYIFDIDLSVFPEWAIRK
ncbi:MAG: SLC13 family permease [Bacteroidales bacterium]|nr:SLC13 family permease [Bacteroidales bacterium]MCF8390929.1 SLC13 family permease [Bacteroidales bacterium]